MHCIESSGPSTVKISFNLYFGLLKCKKKKPKKNSLSVENITDRACDIWRSSERNKSLKENVDNNQKDKAEISGTLNQEKIIGEFNTLTSQRRQ